MADATTWAKRVAAWRASGRPAAEFAAGRGYTASTLRWWASRLGRRDAAFVRVVTTPERVDAPLELETAGVCVRVRAGFDPALLAQVLDVLRGGAT